MLGRQPNLSGLPTLSSSQIRTKPDSLTTLVRALKMCRNPKKSSLPLLKLDQHPRSRESTSPETPTWRTLGSREEVMSWLTTSRGSRTSKTELVVDIETHGDNDFLHPQERPLVCVGLYDGHEVVVIPGYLLDTEWPELIEELKQFDIIAQDRKSGV